MHQYKLISDSNLFLTSKVLVENMHNEKSVYKLHLSTTKGNECEIQFVFCNRAQSTKVTAFPRLTVDLKSRFDLEKIKVIIYDKFNVRVDYFPENGIINLSHLPHGLYVLKMLYDNNEIYNTLFYPPK